MEEGGRAGEQAVLTHPGQPHRLREVEAPPRDRHAVKRLHHERLAEDAAPLHGAQVLEGGGEKGGEGGGAGDVDAAPHTHYGACSTPPTFSPYITPHTHSLTPPHPIPAAPAARPALRLTGALKSPVHCTGT